MKNWIFCGILAIVISLIFTGIVIYNNVQSNTSVGLFVGLGGITFADNPFEYIISLGLVPFIVVFIISFGILLLINWVIKMFRGKK